MARTEEFLIVENDAIISTFICKTIIKMGHQIQAQHDNLNEAIIEFKEGKKYPSQVLIDLDSKWLRERNSLPFIYFSMLHVPVLLTSSLDFEDIKDLLENNTQWKYLQKPYTAKQLKNALEIHSLN